MDPFSDIRPFNDNEVSSILQRLQSDQAFLNTISSFSFPRLHRYLGPLLRRLVAWRLKAKTRNLKTVDDVQLLVESYVAKSIDSTCDSFTISGLEHLQDQQAHLLMANHRDIVMDPALVTYAMYRAKQATPRIAIGDNLLQRPFVSDLMRLNKSFIVKRSVEGRREKLAAFLQLSDYINQSITQDNASIWIAQAEGRAKDGNDETDSAILKMFHMSRKDEDFASVIQSLNLMPVSISYEYDPCDLAKARELYMLDSTGAYNKASGEDDASIAKGITGYKGRVHIHFCPIIKEASDNPKALAKAIDIQIIGNYQLRPIHYLAWQQWGKRDQQLKVTPPAFSAEELAQATAYLAKRSAQCPAEHLPYLIEQYANPVQNYYLLQQAVPQPC
ncbi:1-acyl-sn-glycerol-3-phosphate acyltransferase [Pseudomonas sp. F1_0610]|uniref:1-acyl-sn-glycerol-3-phosphate acyltransferase n=1 Tax=Pseudomonas sp. F1_0610 TaxID=3114284 RepID=UPI0039C381B0